MIGNILSWFFGGSSGPLERLAAELNKAYEVKLKANNNYERIEAERQIVILQARQAVLTIEQKKGLTCWIRPAFALPFVFYNFKIILWDKILGLGITDDLPPSFWRLQMIVFGAYFLTRPLERR
ncbi:MAG: hypothetical protein PSN37_04870 [Alphaproteobacteria bacterium]|nr:hypothetical protein [Alphaproteobacteria bacterium]